MPARSVKQRRLMGMAMHEPEKVMKKNMGVLDMSKTQLSHFAATAEKNLPRTKHPNTPTVSKTKAKRKVDRRKKGNLMSPISYREGD